MKYRLGADSMPFCLEAFLPFNGWGMGIKKAGDKHQLFWF
jgi:hypothetical protein